MKESNNDTILRIVIISICLFFTVIASVNAQTIGKDKYYHLGAGALASSFTGGLAYELTNDLNKSLKISLATGVFVGVAKEVYDSRDGGSGFDIADIGATLVGSLAGTYLTHLINKPRKSRDYETRLL